MRIIVEKDYAGLSQKAAQLTAAFIRENPGSLLCLAAGMTPMGMLKNLIKLQSESLVDLSSVYYAGLDEWVGLGRNDAGSCIQVMFDTFYAPAGIPKERIHVFDGLDPDTTAQCRQMEAWIQSHGGMAFTVLGIGMNGHIGFNEPNTPQVEGCTVVSLDDVTKTVSMKYFGRSIPVTHGVTIGWSALKAAKQVLLIADGAKKAQIVKRALRDSMDASVPASLLQDHLALTVILDEAAASLL